LQSGTAIQTQTGNTAGYPEDVGKIRANINAGVPLYLDGWKNNCNNPLTQRCTYVNSLALFSPPAFMTIGNTPRVPDYLRGPFQPKYNMAILKESPIPEQVNPAFPAELSGAFTHVSSHPGANNFPIYQTRDYRKGAFPPVTATNIAPAYA